MVKLDDRFGREFLAFFRFWPCKSKMGIYDFECMIKVHVT
jgi:hypothetical protein